MTRKITGAGDHRPRQFCAIVEGETLLEKTRRRVGRIIGREQTLVVVTKAHERFYSSQVGEETLLIQPDNKGTTPAIVYSLMRLRELDSRAIVGFFPVDHYFTNDQAFNAYVESAFEVAESRVGQVVLLGVVPGRPEGDYGWIEPGAPEGPGVWACLLRSLFLGEAFPLTSVRAHGAWLPLEQLRDGRSRGRVPASDPAGEPGLSRALRIDSSRDSDADGSSYAGRSLLPYSGRQLFRGDSAMAPLGICGDALREPRLE